MKESITLPITSLWRKKITRKECITEIVRLKADDCKFSRNVKKVNQELAELGEKLGKNAKKKKVDHYKERINVYLGPLNG